MDMPGGGRSLGARKLKDNSRSGWEWAAHIQFIVAETISSLWEKQTAVYVFANWNGEKSVCRISSYILALRSYVDFFL